MTYIIRTLPTREIVLLLWLHHLSMMLNKRVSVFTIFHKPDHCYQISAPLLW